MPPESKYRNTPSGLHELLIDLEEDIYHFRKESVEKGMSREYHFDHDYDVMQQLKLELIDELEGYLKLLKGE